MCLAIPSKIKSIDKETNIATVDTMGVDRTASLDLLTDEIEIGDYVLIHIGYAINKIDEEDAKLSLETFRELLAKMDEEDQKAQIDREASA